MYLNTSLGRASDMAIKLSNVYSVLKQGYTNFLSNWDLVLFLPTLVKSYLKDNDSNGDFN
jgi:hypothetical protein